MDVQLLVADLTNIGGDDLLPISADLEEQVVLRTLEKFSTGVFAQNELYSKHEKEEGEPQVVPQRQSRQ